VDAAALHDLLQQRQQHPQQAPTIDAQIRDRFAITQAVMVLDMVGFSRTTATEGIIPTLARIQQLRAIALPLLESHGGHILKTEADNIYGLFDHPQMAVTATQHLLVALHRCHIQASIGIGYGELLRVGPTDVYGHEMNLASKLGEDLAGPDEILLTPAAYDTLSDLRPSFEVLSTQISGLTLTVHRWIPSHAAPPQQA
jgi:class 3 adenylate cyclase